MLSYRKSQLFFKMAKKTIFKKLFPSPPLLIFLLAATISLSYHLAFLNRIYPGVKIAGVTMGNKTLPEAEAILTAATSPLPETILLTSPGKALEIDLKTLGLSYQRQKVLEKAYQVGRHPNLFRAWQEKKTAWMKGINLPLEYELNQEGLSQRLEEIGTHLFVPAVNPQIKVLETRLAGPGTRITVEPGQNGQELDTRALLTRLSQKFSQFDFTPADLPITKTTPALSEEEVKSLKARAEKFLDKTLELAFDDTVSSLDDKQLISFISPYGGFDQEKIRGFVDNLATGIDREPQNASFRFQAGKVKVFKPAEEGFSLKKPETVTAIVQKLTLLEKEVQESQTLTLEVTKIEPKIKTEDVNNLGIRELIGQGDSYFRGSASSRIHNITLASSRLNGTLIGPGETFSLNQALGEVSLTTGYKEAYIIKEGRTVLGDGGGVCQVSTTLFRAVLNAGLSIIERQAHAYRVGYYEQGFPPGLDATVFAPTADLKFENNTPAYILIQTLVDNPKKHLVFSLYGTSDGRVATIGKSRIWDQTPPPPDLYQDDPTLPVGVVKQVDWAAWGAKVAFDWKVTKDDEVLEERTFYSVYRPWQAVYLKGTGGQ